MTLRAAVLETLLIVGLVAVMLVGPTLIAWGNR